MSRSGRQRLTNCVLSWMARDGIGEDQGESARRRLCHQSCFAEGRACHSAVAGDGSRNGVAGDSYRSGTAYELAVSPSEIQSAPFLVRIRLDDRTIMERLPAGSPCGTKMLRAPTITDWLEVRVLPSPPHSLSNRKISRTRPRSPQLAGICGCVSVSADSFSGLNAFLGRFVSYLQLLVDQSQIEQWQSRMLSCVCIVNEIVASSHRSAFRAQKRDVSVTLRARIGNPQSHSATSDLSILELGRRGQPRLHRACPEVSPLPQSYLAQFGAPSRR